MDPMAEWTTAVCSELGIDACGLDRMAVTDAEREVEHIVAEPAALYTVFLLGVAVGRGLPATEAATRLSALARNWHEIDWRD